MYTRPITYGYMENNLNSNMPYLVKTIDPKRLKEKYEL